MDVCAQGRAATPGERRWDQGDWGPGGRRPGEGTHALLLLGHLCFLLPLFPPRFWSFSSSSLGARASGSSSWQAAAQSADAALQSRLPPLSPKVAAGRRRAAHFQALGRQEKRCAPSDVWFHRITLSTFTPLVSVQTLPTSLLEATQGAARTLGAAGSLSVWDGFQF